jgi:three-Cys-motif partner protein
VKDFHAEAFDEGTKRKLEVFRGYVREWLPVFLRKASRFRTVAIYDFFAGPGADVTGEKGSPLIIAEEVRAFLNNSSRSHGHNEVNLYFNDDDPRKCAELRRALSKLPLPMGVNIEVDNEDFGVAFKKKSLAIAAPDTANLVILDQSGVKHITHDVFRRLVGWRTTDILFFISSAIIKRFAGEGVIAQYFPGISKDDIDGCNTRQIHRLVCEYYRKLVPAGKEYYLAPFSIKKVANVYGLIFGSSNLRGLEKFLRVCWDIDPQTGEATYNIDDDVAWESPTLFPETNVIRKKDDFQSRLLTELRKKPLTNRDLYRYCLESGFLPKHVNRQLKVLRKEGTLICRPKNTRGFYISWDHYSGKKSDIVTFSIKD